MSGCPAPAAAKFIKRNPQKSWNARQGDPNKLMMLLLLLTMMNTIMQVRLWRRVHSNQAQFALTTVSSLEGAGLPFVRSCARVYSKMRLLHSSNQLDMRLKALRVYRSCARG
ncbi:uncharacterized protein K460DRAFT_11746 [Cucurbitaria berberidis CBS 394.84]|uniref:Uncharacterized protein n=1 Tax=Cucurbitaria berberidis CBS 394.84 TaxID=1168544 RepID=A0A9P4GSE0_9PLEO|nr:uncharacterized protein K460DRAFT_11746 [Cucurbitaria berberidis CBS 394.84]KAF1850196.1 hypothetical protein K460DRAFT_11746 [Cucurbitaria berberidis CBS 394.84]